jgi:predicted metalloprotease
VPGAACIVVQPGTALPVDFDDRARLDTSRVRDMRGRRGGGGRGLAVGGGGLGIVGLLIALVLGVDPSQLTGGASGFDSGSLDGGGTVDTAQLADQCESGADADANEICRVVGIDNSLFDFWSTQVQDFRPATTEVFSGGTQTGCGAASSAVGPFYCPPDEGIYLDLGFFEELQTTYGARGGDFAQAYVLAHEYGHHIQTLTGRASGSRQLPEQQGPQGASTRLELQADCYAGAWAANAAREGFLTFDDTDIAEGLSAPRPWATTASRRPPAAGSTPSRGRTARPSSGSAGSPPACAAATRPTATRSPVPTV